MECDEMWTYVGSKKNPTWIWLSWSYQTTQTLSFAIGARDGVTGRIMWEAIPASYGRKQVYTDGYVVYGELIPWGRHWVCPKGSGETNVAEGCNSYLRHRVSYLVRKSSSFARKVMWLYRRLLLNNRFCRNEVIAKKRTTPSKPRKVYTKKSGTKLSGLKITPQQKNNIAIYFPHQEAFPT